MSKIKIGTTIALILLGIALIYSIGEYRNAKALALSTKQELLHANMKIDQLSKLSQIEIDEIDLEQAQLNSKKYAILEADSKRMKEISVWKTRCIKKKIVGEEKNCTENLERYASYNLK